PLLLHRLLEQPHVLLAGRPRGLQRLFVGGEGLRGIADLHVTIAQLLVELRPLGAIRGGLRQAAQVRGGLLPLAALEGPLGRRARDACGRARHAGPAPPRGGGWPGEDGAACSPPGRRAPARPRPPPDRARRPGARPARPVAPPPHATWRRGSGSPRATAW